MIDGRPTRLVQITLMGVIVGVALPIALGELVKNPSWDRICLCIGYTLQTLNFFHGKIATLDDEDYTRILTARPVLAIVDYVLNMAIVIGMVLIALLFANPRYVASANIAVRLLDLVLVLAVRRVSFSPLVLRAQTSWAAFDVATIIVWLVVMLMTLRWMPQNVGPVVGATFLLIALADIMMDYTLNRELYFRSPNPWSKFAPFWDALQGRDGDEYRTSTIIPNLLKELGPLDGRSVLDLGTGNGCVARALCPGGATVVGVDSSKEMAELAAAHGAEPRLSYRIHDLSEAVRFGSFDICISVFSHQDIGNLDHIFKIARMNLVPGGIFALVFEDLDALEAVGEHATTNRRWLDRTRGADDGRTQLVYWNEAGTGRNVAVTETRCWTSAAHVRVAQANSFALRSGPTILCPEAAHTPTLRLYRTQPTFRMLVVESGGLSAAAGFSR